MLKRAYINISPGIMMQNITIISDQKQTTDAMQCALNNLGQFLLTQQIGQLYLMGAPLAYLQHLKTQIQEQTNNQIEIEITGV